ncbi:MAG: LD-carboxypeptidase, partial [Cyanobacteria bacterium REEB67]|nr:LD-carboxypeptidase [Cyanobacteria bacterium REEB67]
MIKPRTLRARDKVALVAPSSRPARPSELARAKRVVSEMGFEPVVGKHALATHGYMAGTDEQRLADLSDALADPEIAAVWAITGGFGTIRLLDKLPYDTFKANPKIVLGCDDFNLILLSLYKKCGVVTLSAPNCDRIDNREIFLRVKDALTSTEME